MYTKRESRKTNRVLTEEVKNKNYSEKTEKKGNNLSVKMMILKLWVWVCQML